MFKHPANNYNTKDKNVRVLGVDSAPANVASIPESCWTFYKECGSVQPPKVTQDKKGKDSLLRESGIRQEVEGLQGQTKPIVPPKVKSAKEIKPRLEPVVQSSEDAAY